MAQQPTLMNVPFANSGAKNSIPQNTTTLGKASLVNGFPTETSMPLADGGIPPQRADFNGMLYWLSSFAVYQQSGGKFTYNSTLDYDPPSIIYYDDDLWWCKQRNGVSTVVKPPGSDSNYWIKLRDYLANPLAAYPVGSYYISAISTSPAVLFGGTWEQIQDRMILAAGSTYSAGTLVNPATGGSSTKQLVTNNIPSHTHTFTTSETGLHTHTASGTTQTAGAHTHDVSGSSSQVSNHTHGVNGNTEETGNHAHSVSGNTAASGQHSHTVSGNTANVDAHTHTVSGNTADSTSHTHSVGGSNSTTGSGGAHSHGVSGTTAANGEHSHTRGTMNITGTFNPVWEINSTPIATGAFRYTRDTGNSNECGDDGSARLVWNFDASRSWTGNTSTISAHTHTFNVTSASSGSHSHNINLTSGAGGVHSHSVSLTTGASNKHNHAISLTTANSVTHTHSISFISSTTGDHRHSVNITSTGAGQHTHTITGTAASNGSHVHTVAITLNDSGKHKHTGTTNATGSGTAFNIMPPYIVAYVWRRTA